MDSSLTSGSGHFDGEWFTEETHGAARQGYRIEKVLHSERSEFQKIDVYETKFFGRLLTLDDLVMFTERDEFVYHEMLVHVPLCSVPDPKNVLIIGGGDAGCIREALRHPSIERVVLCEIDERVTRVCEEWFPWVRECVEDPRVELIFDDGVQYIENSEPVFDLIVIDSTDPVGPAVGLFRREFYGKARDALAPGGVLVAQTESPHWDARAVGVIHGELRAVFPEMHAYWGAIPTYPSGAWTWAYTSLTRHPQETFDGERAGAIAEEALYYNADMHRAAFQLPGFMRRASEGDDPFARFES